MSYHQLQNVYPESEIYQVSKYSIKVQPNIFSCITDFEYKKHRSDNRFIEKE